MKKVMKAVAAIMLMTAVVGIAGCNKPDDPSNGGGNNGGGGTYNGHDYIDLGLPSGTLWATCNVGATSLEGYGDYFAWGETQPKDIYTWHTYKYSNNYSLEHPNLTKYCNISSYGYNGYTDTLTILLPEDDAATANWGSGWRIPTKKQWVEMYQNTTNTWTTQNGVRGRLFTAINGNSLFLPAACDWDDEISPYGSCYGDYWSSSLDPDVSDYAWSFDFGSDRAIMDYGTARCSGISVRPVREN